MPELTKREFMDSLSDEKRFNAIWDWIERLEMAQQHLGAVVQGHGDRLKRVESKAGGSGR